MNEEKIIKALPMYQPYASWLVLGLKKYETRSRRTHHRGFLGVYACKKVMDKKSWDLHNRFYELLSTEERQLLNAHLSDQGSGAVGYPLGELIGKVDIQDSTIMTAETIAQVDSQEKLAGDWRVGRHFWSSTNRVALNRGIPIDGHQGIIHVKGAVAAEFERAIKSMTLVEEIKENVRHLKGMFPEADIDFHSSREGFVFLDRKSVV